MNPYQQLMSTTSLKVTGFIKSISCYNPPDNPTQFYPSIIIDANGMEQGLKVSIPYPIDNEKYAIGAMVKDLVLNSKTNKSGAIKLSAL